MAPILRRAFKIANDPPQGPVFVALPIDVMEHDTSIGPAAPAPLFRAAPPDPAGVAEVARLLKASKQPAIVAGDDVARAGASAALVRLAERVGATMWCEGLRHHASYPTDHPNARGAVGFDAVSIRRGFGDADLVLMVGGPFFEEVWFAPGSPFPDGAQVVQFEQGAERLAHNYPLASGVIGDLKVTLDQVAKAVGEAPGASARNAAHRAQKDTDTAAQRARAEKAWDRVPMSMPRVMAEIRDALPAGAIVVDEAITANIDLARTFTFKGGDYYSGRGGGIGQGLAGALGVKVAQPDRPVVAISGDGSAMYSIQSLWTAAHHDLAIVFVILANREYRVLKHNIDVYRQRFNALSNKPYNHMDLTGPDLGFVEMAAGMGVAGTRVSKPDELGAAIARAFKSGKPHLIEAAIEGKR
jgi:benzoylformate decarboxylase